MLLSKISPTWAPWKIPKGPFTKSFQEGVSFLGCELGEVSGVFPGVCGCFPKIGVNPPKWMVKVMENPMKMDDLGEKTLIFGNTHVGKIIVDSFQPAANGGF